MSIFKRNILLILHHSIYLVAQQKLKMKILSILYMKQQMAYFGLPSNLLFTFGSSTSFSLFFTEGQNDIDTSYVLAQFNGKKQLTRIIFYLRLLG